MHFAFVAGQSQPPQDITGLHCNLLAQIVNQPQTMRDKAMSALRYLKSELINTMWPWEDRFEFEDRRLSCSCV